jgi:hypothetical protein
MNKRHMIPLLVPHNFSIGLGGQACFIRNNKQAWALVGTEN